MVQTLTSLCPITETTTISGKEETVTYTSTSVYTTHVPTYIEVTATAPDNTKTYESFLNFYDFAFGLIYFIVLRLEWFKLLQVFVPLPKQPLFQGKRRL